MSWSSKFVLSRLCLATLPLVVGASCAKEPLSGSKPQEKIDAYNSVDRLQVPITFITDPDLLPSTGHSAKAVWSGSWWPFSQGGTAEPMRKFDLATGNGGKAQAWELHQAQLYGGTSWAGHCNGLAAAGLNEPEPQAPVQYGGQTFSVADQKGLLVEKWQGVRQISLVGRRCDKAPQYDSLGRATNPACRGINPGALHIALGNMLGLRQEPFILDIYPAEQVWNYPVVGYSVTKEEVDAATAQALVGASGGSYAFNPEATQFLKVRAVVALGRGHSDLTLDYVLEGREGQIIGGEWLGVSKAQHPAFAWTTHMPDSANPYLNIQVVDAIVAHR